MSQARDEIRSALLSTHQPRSEKVTLFGQEIELRQPTLQDVMKAQDTSDPAERAADMIIQYAYVPGTDERIFDEGDRQTILRWPFGPEFTELQQAITRLTNVNLDEHEHELRSDPLDSESTD